MGDCRTFIGDALQAMPKSPLSLIPVLLMQDWTLEKKRKQWLSLKELK